MSADVVFLVGSLVFLGVVLPAVLSRAAMSAPIVLARPCAEQLFR